MGPHPGVGAGPGTAELAARRGERRGGREPCQASRDAPTGSSRDPELVADLLHLDAASLLGGPVGGLDERHRPERRPAGDRRLGVLLDRAHQLAHRALERLREPPLLPAGPLPSPSSVTRRPLDRRGASGRIVGPSDRALGDALRALDSPLNVVVDPRVAVVEADRAKAVLVLEDVEGHAVLVREVVARVVADRDDDPLGIAEQVAERVEVVDRHVEQGDPPVRLDELLPVRPGVHDDLAHDRLAEHALVEQRLAGPASTGRSACCG